MNLKRPCQQSRSLAIISWKPFVSWPTGLSIYIYNIAGFVVFGWLSFPSIRPVVHPVIHPSLHPSKAKRGRARAFLKLQNSTVSGNCPLCPIYSTIGIHHVMKGYWPIIKISGKHWGRFGMQWVQPIFPFFGFWG